MPFKYLLLPVLLCRIKIWGFLKQELNAWRSFMSFIFSKLILQRPFLFQFLCLYSFNIPNISFGFKSGYILGQAIFFSSLRNSCVTLAVCFGWLLWWKNSVRLPEAVGREVVFSDSILVYPQALTKNASLQSFYPIIALLPLCIHCSSPNQAHT